MFLIFLVGSVKSMPRADSGVCVKCVCQRVSMQVGVCTCLCENVYVPEYERDVEEWTGAG